MSNDVKKNNVISILHTIKFGDTKVVVGLNDAQRILSHIRLYQIWGDKIVRSALSVSFGFVFVTKGMVILKIGGEKYTTQITDESLEEIAQGIIDFCAGKGPHYV